MLAGELIGYGIAWQVSVSSDVLEPDVEFLDELVCVVGLLGDNTPGFEVFDELQAICED